MKLVLDYALGKPLFHAFCLSLTLLGGGLLSAHAEAEKGYYRWVDDRGNPKISDRPPPPGVEYTFTSTDTGLKRQVTAEDRKVGATPQGPSKPTPSRGAAQQQASVMKDQTLCDQAKANLDTLNSNARVRIRENDEVRYLTPEEIDIQRQKAVDLIAVHCPS